MDVKLIVSGEEREYKNVRTYKDVALLTQTSLPSLAVFINGKIRDLNTPVNDGDDIHFIDYSHEEGRRAYVRSLTFILIRAVKELFPSGDVLIDHTVGDGLYCKLDNVGFVTSRDYKNIEDRMWEIVKSDEPFIQDIISVEDAREYYEKNGQYTTARLLIYKKHGVSITYKLGKFRESLHGVLLPSTSYVNLFSLKSVFPGMILYLPTLEDGKLSIKFIKNQKYLDTFGESERSAANLSCSFIPDLNDITAGGRMAETIVISEIQHEKNLSRIADEICSSENKRIILVSGPSSSGKTTFANRLYAHLRSNSKRPIIVSLDNYYLDREDIGLDEYGEKDLENIDSLDLDLFSEQLNCMLQNEEVELPIYSFKKGRRETTGKKMKVFENQPIIVEGIHALNPRISEGISKNYKYGIYISPFAPINYDMHNRVPTTDIRMIRRLVRDHSYRGFSADSTIAVWPSVLRGERKYIFPYQENADTMFNSSLVYELAVLKKYAYPLLSSLTDNENTHEIKRVLRLLNYVVELDDETEAIIPATSILREFIGGSCF